MTVRGVNKWIKKKQAKKPQPYQRAEYPGQKVQIDVKFVPLYCGVNGQKYYQYTIVDECTPLDVQRNARGTQHGQFHISSDFVLTIHGARIKINISNQGAEDIKLSGSGECGASYGKR